MGELSDRGVTWVAERDHHILGFIRLLEDAGQWYVNPVVVDSSYRREGLGAALMLFAHKRYGELRFVARGYAVPFYEALGCENIPWDVIAPLVADDCDGCSMLATCHPQPMRLP
ncbi:MAG: GNAT family N-acetyltransferase [Adlercreutzia sp.]|nr:GNAT family N-acetyltransferase [Adlercreutzia sp.]